MSRRIRTIAVVVSTAALAVIALAGCGPAPAPMPVPDPSPSASLTAGAQELPDQVPDYRPEGTATQNELYFTWVLQQYRAVYGIGTADALVATVVGAGFPIGALEVTPEFTAIGLAADSVVISVNVQGECLIGQIFADHEVTMIAPVLATGRCLVGETHPIQQ